MALRHLRLANGGQAGLSTAGKLPIGHLCYIFVDWGSCDTLDQCGFDFGSCPQEDLCLIDY